MITISHSNYTNNNIVKPRKPLRQCFYACHSLSKDTVSFGAMKKSQFKLFDLAAVNFLKIPIEKFNDVDDFSKWVEAEIAKVKQIATSNETNCRYREERLQKFAEWDEFFAKNRDKYPQSLHLIALDSFAKKLRKGIVHVPMFIETEVLSKLVGDLQSKLAQDKSYTFNFEKKYEQSLFEHFLSKEKGSLKKGTGWISIPSAGKAPEDFEKNLQRLKVFSAENWCTRRPVFSKEYLENSDFHILLENDKPKIAIRLLNNQVIEIVGPENGNITTLSDYQKTMEFLSKNDFEYQHYTDFHFKDLKSALIEIEELKLKLKSKIESKDYDGIFEYFGFGPQRTEQNELVLREVRPISEVYGLHNLGIDVDEMFADVVRVKKDARFSNLPLTQLPNLRETGGYTIFNNTHLKKLEKFENAGIVLSLYGSEIVDLPNLRRVESQFDLTGSKIRCIPNLEYVGGNLFATYSPFKDTTLAIESMPKLRIIKGDAEFADSPIKNLNSLEIISGNANFSHAEIESLPSLTRLGKNADFANSKIKSLPKLVEIDGDVKFDGSQISDLSSLLLIRGCASFCQTPIRSIPKLFKICGNASFRTSQIEELPKLVKVNGALRCEQCHNLRNLDRLESVQYYLGLWGTQVKNLPRLQKKSGIDIAGIEQ